MQMTSKSSSSSSTHHITDQHYDKLLRLPDPGREILDPWSPSCQGTYQRLLKKVLTLWSTLHNATY